MQSYPFTMEFIPPKALVSSIRILSLTLLHCFWLTPVTPPEGKTSPVAFLLTVHSQLTWSQHKKTQNLSILQISGRKAHFCKSLNWTACSHLLPPPTCYVCKAPRIRCSRAWSFLLRIIVINNTTTLRWTCCRSAPRNLAGRTCKNWTVWRGKEESQGIVAIGL